MTSSERQARWRERKRQRDEAREVAAEVIGDLLPAAVAGAIRDVLPGVIQAALASTGASTPNGASPQASQGERLHGPSTAEGTAAAPGGPPSTEPSTGPAQDRLQFGTPSPPPDPPHTPAYSGPAANSNRLASTSQPADDLDMRTRALVDMTRTTYTVATGQAVTEAEALAFVQSRLASRPDVADPGRWLNKIIRDDPGSVKMRPEDKPPRRCGSCGSEDHPSNHCPKIDAEQDRRTELASRLGPDGYSRAWAKQVRPDRGQAVDAAGAAAVIRDELAKRKQTDESRQAPGDDDLPDW